MRLGTVDGETRHQSHEGQRVQRPARRHGATVESTAEPKQMYSTWSYYEEVLVKSASWHVEVALGSVIEALVDAEALVDVEAIGDEAHVDEALGIIDVEALVDEAIGSVPSASMLKLTLMKPSASSMFEPSA